MKNTIITVVVLGIILGGGYFLLKGSSNDSSSASQNFSSAPTDNVSVVDGKQIITINTKGGYQPQRTIAKAGMATVIRFATNGTFDCSASVRIPSLGINKILPSDGNTDIDIGTPQVAKLQGLCVMGMYRFEVDFQS